MDFILDEIRKRKTIYYVDATGGDDSNTGRSSAEAWQTLSKVETAVVDNCTVKFKRSETWTVKGTANANAMLFIQNNNVTLDAYGTGDKPVLDLGGTIRTGITHNASKDGLIVKNFRVYNGGGGTGALFAVTGSNTGTIVDSELDTHAVDAGATAGVGSTLIVRNCVISSCADDGVTCHGLNGTGSTCYVYSTTIRNGFDGVNHSVTNGGDITSLFEDCIFYNNSSHDLGGLGIGNHTFRRCRFGHTLQAGQSPSIVQATNEYSIAFEYCIIDGTRSAGNAQPGIANSGATTTMTFKNCTFRGNPAVGGNTGNIVAWPGSISLTNCVVSDWFRCAYMAGGGAVNADHCVFYNLNTKSLTTNTNEVSTADPLFVDPANGDFHLQAGSPCRNAGADVGLTTDFDGVSVPQETNPAVGAFEYV